MINTISKKQKKNINKQLNEISMPTQYIKMEFNKEILSARQTDTHMDTL